jgi:transposase
LVGDEGKTENHVRQNLGYSVSDSEGRKIRVWLTLAPSVRPPSAPRRATPQRCVERPVM